MTAETFERVCHWIKILNPSGKPAGEISWLQGFGEPLLNPNIMSFVSRISKLTTVGFSTNGALLTEEKIRHLDAAGLSALTVSGHQPEVAERAFTLLRRIKPRFMVISQSNFNDDFAGQVKNDSPNAPPAYFHCTYVENGAVHVLWDGRIPTCCTDAKGHPILGSVYDEIRDIDLDVIPLCKKCRSGVFVVPAGIARYSPSLSREEKERLYWAHVQESATRRHRADLDNGVRKMQIKRRRA